MSPPEPTVGELLARIATRLDRIEARLDDAGRTTAEILPMTATMVDTLDRAAADLQARGVDLDARGRAALSTIEAWSDPAKLDALTRLAGKVEALEAAADVAVQVPGLFATAVDSADGLAAKLPFDALEAQDRLIRLARITEKLSRPQNLALLERLVDHVFIVENLIESDVLDPGAVSVVGAAGAALRDTRDDAPAPVGPLGLLGALFDVEVQRAISFGLQFARRFVRRTNPASI